MKEKMRSSTIQHIIFSEDNWNAHHMPHSGNDSEVEKESTVINLYCIEYYI